MDGLSGANDFLPECMMAVCKNEWNKSHLLSSIGEGEKVLFVPP